MDLLKGKERIIQLFSKYKYVGIVLLVGIVMLIIPTKSSEELENHSQDQEIRSEELSIQNQLESILSDMDGAGQVRVLLSIAQGERTIYQTDSTYAQSDHSTDTRTETVLISDSQRNETGLIHQKSPPVYQGAIIITEGADIPIVKLAIVDAVSNITGLGTDRISVLKMK